MSRMLTSVVRLTKERECDPPLHAVACEYGSFKPLLSTFGDKTRHSDGRTQHSACSAHGRVSRTQPHRDRTLPHTRHTGEHEGQSYVP